MLYQFYETQRSLMEPFADLAQTAAKVFANPLFPAGQGPFAQRMSAGFDLLHRLGKDYEKPEFGIRTIDVDGDEVAIHERVELSKPFCELRRFKRLGEADVLLVRDLRVVPHPLVRAGELPVPLAARAGVEPEVHEHPEARVAPPLHAVGRRGAAIVGNRAVIPRAAQADRNQPGNGNFVLHNQNAKHSPLLFGVLHQATSIGFIFVQPICGWRLRSTRGYHKPLTYSLASSYFEEPEGWKASGGPL